MVARRYGESLRRLLRRFPVVTVLGASWEGFVIDQLLSAFQRAAPRSQGLFWRTARGDEVDLVIEMGTRRIPFEIKLHSSPRAEDTRAPCSAACWI
jgi:predicted AAA+ superfamily ATPase